MKKLLALALLSTTATASEVKWDSLEVSKQKVNNEHFYNFDGHGYSGTRLINDSIILSASKRELSSDVNIWGFNVDLEAEVLALSIGGKKSVSHKTDLYFLVSYLDLSAKASILGYSESSSESGEGLSVGIRSMVSHDFELSAQANFYDADLDNSIIIGGHYFLADNFSLGMSYEKDSESAGTNIVARMYF